MPPLVLSRISWLLYSYSTVSTTLLLTSSTATTCIFWTHLLNPWSRWPPSISSAVTLKFSMSKSTIFSFTKAPGATVYMQKLSSESEDMLQTRLPVMTLLRQRCTIHYYGSKLQTWLYCVSVPSSGECLLPMKSAADLIEKRMTAKEKDLKRQGEEDGKVNLLEPNETLRMEPGTPSGPSMSSMLVNTWGAIFGKMVFWSFSDAQTVGAGTSISTSCTRVGIFAGF